MEPYLYTMIWVTIISVLITFVMMMDLKFHKEEWRDALKTFGLLFLVVFIVGSVLGVIITAIVVSQPNYETTIIYEDTPIYSLKTNTFLEGSFFLGCGYIRDVESYIYFADAGGGGVVRQSVPTQGVIIYQDEPDHPYLRAWISTKVDTKTGKIHRTVLDTTTYEIHIPPGSIIQEYSP